MTNMQPLAPEKTKIKYLIDGVLYKAIYIFTRQDGEYVYHTHKEVKGAWEFVSHIYGSVLVKKLESGEYDEVKEIRIPIEYGEVRMTGNVI